MKCSDDDDDDDDGARRKLFLDPRATQQLSVEVVAVPVGHCPALVSVRGTGCWIGPVVCMKWQQLFLSSSHL